MAFYFERPNGYVFRAGQYLNLTLLDPLQTDEKGSVRPFSIASAPFEEDLMIATRMRDSAFKRTLKTMEIGKPVQISSAMGLMAIAQDPRPLVFLAGGIGITPFRSMILQAEHEKIQKRMYLFYSNRTIHSSAFLQELQNVKQKNPLFSFIPTITEKRGESWNGERGHITKEMFEKYIENIGEPMYYVAGPPAMVRAMEEMLQKANVPDEQIRTEEFSGY